MTNPYTPPQGNPQAGQPQGPHGFWTFFFWLNAIFVPLILIGITMMPLAPLDYVDLTLFFVNLTGLYGYVFRKRIAGAPWWRLACGTYLLWFIAYEYVLPFGFGLVRYGEQPALGIDTLISAALSIPMIVALYLYGFRSDDIWNPGPPPEEKFQA